MSIKYDIPNIESLSDSATFRAILSMSIPNDEQLKSQLIINLCEFMDSGALLFPNDTVKRAFLTLLAMALHDELNIGGEA